MNRFTDFTFFWEHKEEAIHPECSQFYQSPFTINNITFNSCEQWMHWKKAILFNDLIIAKQILKEKSPFKQKNWGRKVKNFNAEIWSQIAPDIVFRGNIEKFSQNKDLLQRLSQTKDTLLVEASPYDVIWGIGLKASDPKALNPKEWRGQNLLGSILTRVRVVLIKS